MWVDLDTFKHFQKELAGSCLLLVIPRHLWNPIDRLFLRAPVRCKQALTTFTEVRMVWRGQQSTLLQFKEQPAQHIAGP